MIKIVASDLYSIKHYTSIGLDRAYLLYALDSNLSINFLLSHC